MYDLIIKCDIYVCIDLNGLLYQAVNLIISAVKLVILTLRSMKNDSRLDPPSSGHTRNCNLFLVTTLIKKWIQNGRIIKIVELSSRGNGGVSNKKKR